MDRAYRKENVDYSSYPFSSLTDKIIGCAIRVHKSLGPGFVESIYENALIHELEKEGLHYERQKVLDILYENYKIGKHRVDLVVENNVIVELKAVKKFCADDVKRMVSYLKATHLKVGLLINFGGTTIAVRRLVL